MAQTPSSIEGFFQNQQVQQIGDTVKAFAFAHWEWVLIVIVLLLVLAALR